MSNVNMHHIHIYIYMLHIHIGHKALFVINITYHQIKSSQLLLFFFIPDINGNTDKQIFQDSLMGVISSINRTSTGASACFAFSQLAKQMRNYYTMQIYKPRVFLSPSYTNTNYMGKTYIKR